MVQSLPTLLKNADNCSLFWYKDVPGWANSYMFVIGDNSLEEYIGKALLDRLKNDLLEKKQYFMDLTGSYHFYEESGHMRVHGIHDKSNLGSMLRILESCETKSSLQLDAKKIKDKDLFSDQNSKSASVLYQGFSSRKGGKRFFVPASQLDYVQKNFGCSETSQLSFGYKEPVLYLSLGEKFAGISQINLGNVKKEHNL